MIYLKAAIRRQILSIENDPNLDDGEKAKRKQVCLYILVYNIVGKLLLYPICLF